MFEDGPPPLPSSPPPDSNFDGNFADLNDENRLTAVADDDFDQKSNSSVCMIVEQSLSPPLPSCRSPDPKNACTVTVTTAEHGDHILSEQQNEEISSKQKPLKADENQEIRHCEMMDTTNHSLTDDPLDTAAEFSSVNAKKLDHSGKYVPYETSESVSKVPITLSLLAEASPISSLSESFSTKASEESNIESMVQIDSNVLASSHEDRMEKTADDRQDSRIFLMIFKSSCYIRRFLSAEYITYN